MATCLQSITTLMAGPGIGSLVVINPNTNTLVVCSPTLNQLLLAQMEIQQTVTFTVSLSSSIPGSFNVGLTIYQVVGSVVNSYASITCTSTTTTFSKDFTAGNYVFCFHVNNAATYIGNILGSFEAIPSSAVLFPTFPTGENMKITLTTPAPPRVCSQIMFYEVVDGEMPPGVFLDELGTLRGTLPNLDCAPEDVNGYSYSPSFNWFYERSGSAYPLGRQWRFKVRLMLASNEDVFVENWFCIRVFNNWDFDRDNFIAQGPFDHTTTVIEYDPPAKLELPCEDCPPDPKAQPVVLKTLNSLCVPCDSPPETSQVTLIPIPEELLSTPPSQFALWFAHNQGVDYSKSCPSIQTFIDNLKGSDLFNKLLAQNGLAPSTAPTKQEILIATTYQNYLQIAISSLVDGRNASDIDQQLLNWQFEQNQANPLFTDVYSGESIPPFELTFSDHG